MKSLREKLATKQADLDGYRVDAVIANRLLEASQRKFWQPAPHVLEALRQAGDELEDRLEGVFEGVHA